MNPSSDRESGAGVMRGRRDLLKQICVLGASAVPLVQSACTAAAVSRPGTGAARVRSIVRREDTTRRLGGMGFGYQSTWAADDRQFMMVNDGSGWSDPPTAFHNARLWSVAGGVDDPAFTEVSGFPDLSYTTRPRDAPRYFGVGLLAVRGRIYQFLNTLDRAEDRPRHWTGAKLIYSDDGGRTWRNQDGSTPVIWEDWNAQSRDRFTFFGEPDGCFAMLSILQMGRDYSANRDGYIYVYGLNGNVDGLMNQLVMYRVPIDRMLDRAAYEYFGGFGKGGAATWSGDIDARRPVHVFPRGWVNGTNLFPGDLVVESWLPSVVYNEPLGLYMMVNTGIGCAPDGTEFGKPSYFGCWVSATPWGPWRQVHEDAAWTPGGDPASRAYVPRIAPKWIAPDGKSFWLVWSDIKGIREFGRDEVLMQEALAKAKTPQEHSAVELDFLRRYMPGMTLNTQRVDLVLD